MRTLLGYGKRLRSAMAAKTKHPKIALNAILDLWRHRLSILRLPGTYSLRKP